MSKPNDQLKDLQKDLLDDPLADSELAVVAEGLQDLQTFKRVKNK